jgi:SNF2 family DNA or RNA helicase
MGRQKSVPTKLNNSGEHWNWHKPLDYIPIKKRRSRKKACTGPFHNVIVASEKNKEFLVGEICVGSTNNVLPESWRSCKMSFFTPEESDEEHLLIKLDSTSLLVKLLPEFDLIKEIITAKIFAINIRVLDGDVHFDVYFCNLPLPKFNKRVGLCIQSVLSLLLGVSVDSDSDETEMDQSSDYAINRLYTNVKKTREKEISLGCDNVQDPRLKPELRPYQADAVRWMLHRETRACDAEGELHPLYTVIKLKSGLDIYYDTYSGYVELIKPTVETSTRGGILADEMGLGKTVEVLACILTHPAPDSGSRKEPSTSEQSPTVELISKKRKIHEPPPPETTLVDNPKKLKVPEDWVKGKSKRSQMRVALEMWYNSCLQDVNKKTTNNRETHSVQCVCGKSHKEGSFSCVDCEKIQHGGCLGYKSKCGPYRCPQCWMNQPLVECKATLIVSPASLRTQWCKEICKHIRGDFRVLQYGGSSLTPIYPTELAKYDVVITTYNVLQSELRLTETEKTLSFRYQRRYSAPGSPLTRVKWWRLCLDEAQTVETPTSMVSAMAKKLSANFRWAVTGTPISKEISGEKRTI